MKKYNRTLLVALLIVAVFATAIGGTFAWFTDNVEVTGNVIESGTLDIDIELKKGDSWISLEENPETKIYNYDLWEPGYTQVETMKIVNNGNLALEYILNVVPGADQKFGPNGESLAEQIEVYMSFGEFTASAENAAETREDFHDAKAAGIDTTVANNRWWYCGTLDNMITRDEGFTGGVLLPASETSTTLPVGSVACTIALHMNEEAGNEYQNLSLGTAGFKLQAKQYTYEPDSFDNQYDKDATYVQLPPATSSILTEEQITGIELSSWAGFNPSQVPMDLKIDENHMTLDYGLNFTAKETAADLPGKPYEKWNADFVVTTNKSITEDDYADGAGAPLVLVGEYGTYGWVPIAVEFPVEADAEYRLLKSFIDLNGGTGYFSYADVLNFVGSFNCGIKADRAWATPGTTITVKLNVYATEVVDGKTVETDTYTVAIASYTYE